jgi:hypothetical protein
VYKLVPQPGPRRFDDTRSAQEYGHVHGDVLSAPGFIRIRVSDSEVTVEHALAYLGVDERGGRENGQAAYFSSINAAAK